MLAGFSVGLKLWNVVLAFAGNTIGVWRALRGQHFVTWNVSEFSPPDNACHAGGRTGFMTERRAVEWDQRWRVALIDPGDFTPAYDLALANGLLDAAHEICCIGSYGFREAGRLAFRHEHFYRGLDRPLMRQLPATLLRAAKGASHGLDMATLGKRLQDWRPDIVHFQWLPLPLMDRLFLPRLQRFVPLVITLHDSNPYNGAVGRLMRLGYLAMIHGADAVIVHTAQAEARLAELGLPSSRVHRLPHGLLHRNESVSPEPPSPRERL